LNHTLIIFVVRHRTIKRGKPSNRRSDNDASESGGHDSCCPHVVDPWLFMGILAGLAVTTFLLRMQITMFIVGRRRRKRSSSNELGSTRFVIKYNNIKWDWAYKSIITGRN
jgi:hypothetical protein